MRIKTKFRLSVECLLTLFLLEKPRKSPPQTHHLHSRRLISALNVRRRDRLDVINSLPLPWGGWSVDTNTGPNSQYLHALNLRNSQQHLNLEAFRNERAETSHTLVQND